MHLFYATSSFVHHFVAISDFKLEIQSGNGQFGSKPTIFRAVWPCNLTYDLEQGKSEGFESCDRPIVGKRPIWVKIGDVLYHVTLKFLEPCDLEIWRMTLKNNRAPLLCYFKLYASFRSHRWIQTGVTVRKRPIWVKIDDFFSRVTLQFDVWPWKTIGHLFYATLSFMHHFVAIGDFKLELQSGNAQFRSNSTIFIVVWPWNLTDDLEKQKGTSSKQHQAICIISSSYVNSNWSYSPETVKLGCDLFDLDLWPLTLTFCMDLTLVIGNNSWKFHDDTMMGT